MDRVAMFRAEDGKMFDDRVECLLYEKKQAAMKKIRDIAEPAINTGRLEAFLIAMIEDPAEIRDVLSSLVAAMKKLKHSQEEENHVVYGTRHTAIAA